MPQLAGDWASLLGFLAESGLRMAPPPPLPPLQRHDNSAHNQLNFLNISPELGRAASGFIIR